MGAHTSGPWIAQDGTTSGREVIAPNAPKSKRVVARYGGPDRDMNSYLGAAGPEMLEALKNVQALISEAASTGFNHNDGDWPKRLFESQQVTSQAIRKAEGRT